MTPTERFRRILWAAAVFNVMAGGLLAFPASPLGALAGLPTEVPLVYRGIVTTFVLLFAGVYAWLACQREPDRPMVVLGAVGKASVVALVTALWLAGEASLPSLAAVSGDLVFALAFVWWLTRSREHPAGPLTSA